MKKTSSALIIFLTLIALFELEATICAQASGDLMTNAKTAIEKGNYAAAIEDLSQAIKLDPNDVEAYGQRARAYFLSNQADAALADAEKVISLRPRAPEALNIRGLIKKQRNDLDGAVADFTLALEAVPKFAKAFVNRGDAYNAQKKYDLAILDFNKALELQPDLAIGYYWRAAAYEAQSNYDPAVADYTQYLLLNPSSAEVYNNRGSDYSNLGKLDLALADLRKALELDPQYKLAKQNLDVVTVELKYVKPGTTIDSAASRSAYQAGLAFYNKNDYEAAIKSFTECLTAQPYAGNCYYYRAVSRRLSKKYVEAISDFTSALELSPNQIRAYAERAASYLQIKQYEAALADYNQFFLNPSEAKAYDYANRGYVYAQLNKLNEAAADYRKALELDPQQTFAKQNLPRTLARLKYLKPRAPPVDEAAAAKAYQSGTAFYNKKDYDAAIKSFTDCLSAMPYADKCYFFRAESLRLLGKFGEAIPEYDSALELNPDESRIYGNRAYCYLQIGKYDAAIKDYDRAIKYFPQNAIYYQGRGAAYYDLGNPAQAEIDTKKSLELDPNESSAKTALEQIKAKLQSAGNAPPPLTLNIGATSEQLLERGIAEYNRKDYEAAIKSFSMCLQNDPKNYVCYYNRGASYGGQGKLKEGLAEINKSLEINPQYQLALDGKQQLTALIAEADRKAGAPPASGDPIEQDYKQLYDDYVRAADDYYIKGNPVIVQYKEYTGNDPFDVLFSRPLQTAQKTTLCRMLKEAKPLADLAIEKLTKLGDLSDEGKLGKYPNLKAAVDDEFDSLSNPTIFYILVDQFGCGFEDTRHPQKSSMQKS